MLMQLFFRDVLLAFRRGGGALSGIIFYVLAFVLFAFALGPDRLAAAAPGVLCVTLLLALIISLPWLFERDAEDGSLEIYLTQPVAVEALVAVKLLAYWLTHALPMVLLAPCLAGLAGVLEAEIGAYVLRLFLASFALLASGAMGAALTLQQRGGVVARALIILPFYIPVLIFTLGDPREIFPTLLLAGWTTFILPVSCWLCSVLIKVSQE